MAYRVYMDRKQQYAWVHRGDAPDVLCRPVSKGDNRWSDAFARYMGVELFAYEQGLDVRYCKVCFKSGWFSLGG